MSSKKISLTGEVHISTGSIYTTVDALEAMKVIGLAYGLYSHAEEVRGQRVMLDEGGDPHPVKRTTKKYKDFTRHRKYAVLCNRRFG